MSFQKAIKSLSKKQRLVLLSGLSLAAAILVFVPAFTFTESRGFVRVRGDTVIDSSENPVSLRGLNLEFKDFKTVLNEQDIRRISDMGANSVRLALDGRDLESSPYQYSDQGFALLDKILGWCERYGIYVILDLHLAPGIQNPHDFVVHRENRYLFWETPAFQERFYALWDEIARRYADRRIIAGYDLLNEGVPPSLNEYRHVMNSAARRIRARDPHHMLIVQEAILSGWVKELVLVEDRNVLYSIHFFYPPQFSFYATTTDRPITTYPGAMVTAGEPMGETKSEVITGTAGWDQIKIRAAPPKGAEILVVRITSRGNHGRIWFDDARLEVNGESLDLPAPLISNNSFEIDYPGFNWDTDNPCVRVSSDHARTGTRSLAFYECKSPASGQSSPLEVKKGVHLLSLWYSAEDATGETRLSLSWHKKRVIKEIHKESLRERMTYALRFREQHTVPLYVGEFTAHANPSADSVMNYLRDLLSLMRDENLHWSFWEYYSVYPGVGLFTGNFPRIIHQTAFDVLGEYMKTGMLK
jgi:hypothetical protein